MANKRCTFDVKFYQNQICLLKLRKCTQEFTYETPCW